METVTSIISWVTNQDNIKTVLAGLGGLYALLFAITKLTPTPKDDEFLAKVWAIVGKYTGIKK